MNLHGLDIEAAIVDEKRCTAGRCSESVLVILTTKVESIRHEHESTYMFFRKQMPPTRN